MMLTREELKAADELDEDEEDGGFFDMCDPGDDPTLGPPVDPADLSPCPHHVLKAAGCPTCKDS